MRDTGFKNCEASSEGRVRIRCPIRTECRSMKATLFVAAAALIVFASASTIDAAGRVPPGGGLGQVGSCSK